MRRKCIVVILYAIALIAVLAVAYEWRKIQVREAQPIIDTWAPRLVDIDRTVRQQALKELKTVGPLCVPAVLELLEDDQQQLRRWGGAVFVKRDTVTHSYCYEVPELFFLIGHLVWSSGATKELEDALKAGLEETDEKKKVFCSLALRGISETTTIWPGRPERCGAFDTAANSDDEIAQKIGHPDVVVRRWAALEYYLGRSDRKKEFHQAINDTDHVVRLITVAKSRHSFNDVTKRALIASLSDESKLVRAAALAVLYEWALGSGKSLNREDIPELKNLLKDESGLVRQRVLLLICRLGLYPEEIAMVLEWLERENDGQELLNAEAEAFAKDGYRFRLIRNERRPGDVLRSERSSLLREAARAFGRIRPPVVAALPFLKKLVTDQEQNSYVRVNAAIALVQTDPTSEVGRQALLDAVRQNDSVLTASAVAKALGELPLEEETLSLLVDSGLRHTSDEVLLATAKYLNESEPQSERFGQAIANLASYESMHKDLNSRLFREVALPILTAALSGSRPDVQLDAAVLLTFRAPKTPGLFEAFSEFIKVQGTESHEVRMRREACMCLGAIGDPRGRPLLKEALDDEVERVRKAAADGLRLLNQKEPREAPARTTE